MPAGGGISIFTRRSVMWCTRRLYRRNGWVLLQHLILAVHLHTFLYLLVLVVSGWSGLIGLVWPWRAQALEVAACVYVPVYLLLALHHCFPERWRRTFWKTLRLAWAYVFTVVAATAVTGMFVFWFA